MHEDELDKLKQEDAKEKEIAFYTSLEDNILFRRAEIAAQARLYKEMGVSGGFMDRILELEDLQQSYDEWDGELPA